MEDTTEPGESASAQERLALAEATAAQAVARYRDTVAAGQDLVAEMVQGSTIEEVDASAQEARRAYAEISRRVATQYERQIPTGNPARSDINAGLDALKPEAKIALALRRAGNSRQ